MKRTLFLSMALALTATQSYAQQNLLVNGDFEQPVETFSPYEWVPDFLVPVYIPGWDKSEEYAETGKLSFTTINNDGQDIWNGTPQILPQEPDGDIIMDDNTQYLRLKRKEDNGWQDVCLYQTVNVVPDTEYTLSFISRYAEGFLSDWLQETLECGYRVYDREKGGVVLVSASDLKNAGWERHEVAFTPTSDKIVLQLYINNDNYDKNGRSDDVYIDFDDVAVIGQAPSGISGILTDGADGPVAVYDLTGREIPGVRSMADLSSLKGVYLLEQGGNVRKILLE